MESIRTFTLPDLGEGLEDATVVDWLVEDGQEIGLNQALCIVSTAKVDVEIPSPFAGRVVRRHAGAGTTVPVGAPLIDVEVTPSPGDTPSPGSPPADVPLADSPPLILVGYGPVADAPPQSLVAAPQASATPGPRRALAKPPVRALAKRRGVDIAGLAPGSGPGGIVTREDVEDAARLLGPRRPPPKPGWDEPGASQQAGGGAPARSEGHTVIPVRGARAVIAEHMSRSRREIPEAWCGRWVDAESFAAQADTLRAEALRSEPDGALARALTPFALLLRIVVAQLRRHPTLNATFDAAAQEIRCFDHVHLGVAVADEHGLVVPVVRHAEQLPGAALAIEVRRLIDAVHARRAELDEVRGSTFTVSNFGALGLDDGNPVINAPEAAILGVGALRPRPVVVDGELAVRRTMKLTCAFDHRICDGAEVGAFLGAVAACVEQPARLLLDL